MAADYQPCHNNSVHHWTQIAAAAFNEPPHVQEIWSLHVLAAQAGLKSIVLAQTEANKHQQAFVMHIPAGLPAWRPPFHAFWPVQQS